MTIRLFWPGLQSQLCSTQRSWCCTSPGKKKECPSSKCFIWSGTAFCNNKYQIQSRCTTMAALTLMHLLRLFTSAHSVVLLGLLPMRCMQICFQNLGLNQKCHMYHSLTISPALSQVWGTGRVSTYASVFTYAHTCSWWKWFGYAQQFFHLAWVLWTPWNQRLTYGTDPMEAFTQLCVLIQRQTPWLAGTYCDALVD